MSNQEAIALLRNLEDSLDSYCELSEEGKTVFRMAIEALSSSEFPNNSDAISRQEAIDALNSRKTAEQCEAGKTRNWTVDICVDMIKQLPPIQPKRGRWISADAMFHGVPFYCSECGENTRDTVMGEPRWNFCPNCGCRMDGGE